MTHVLTTRSLHHSGAILEAALLFEDASISAAPMLSVIPELSPSGDFNSAQDNYDNRSSWFSPSVTPRQHIIPDLCFQFTACSSSHFITWNALQPEQLWIETDFSTCNPNNQEPIITAVTKINTCISCSYENHARTIHLMHTDQIKYKSTFSSSKKGMMLYFFFFW